MKQIRSFGLLIFAGIMWWGLVYPELCFMEGTYEIATDTAVGVLAEQKGLSDEEALKELMEAGPEKLIVKSKIMRKLSQ